MLATRTVDVEFLKQQENTRGLLKALAPKAGLETRRQAAGALRWLGLGQRRVAQALGRLVEDSETPESLREVAETSLAVHNFVARGAGRAASQLRAADSRTLPHVRCPCRAVAQTVCGVCGPCDPLCE